MSSAASIRPLDPSLPAARSRRLASPPFPARTQAAWEDFYDMSTHPVLIADGVASVSDRIDARPGRCGIGPGRHRRRRGRRVDRHGAAGRTVDADAPGDALPGTRRGLERAGGRGERQQIGEPALDAGAQVGIAPQVALEAPACLAVQRAERVFGGERIAGGGVGELHRWWRRQR